MRTSQEVEAIIARIPGVDGVRVTSNGSTPKEVHVLATSSRHPMQIVRDIESAVAAHAGIRLDRRTISVAQLGEESKEPPRLALDTVQLRLRGDTTEVLVELALGGATYVGTARGPSSRLNRVRLAAEATMAAVTASLHDAVQLYVEGVQLAPVGGMEAVVTTAILRKNGSEQALVGSCFVWRDEAESAARAALAAVNRRYGVLRRRVLGLV